LYELNEILITIALFFQLELNYGIRTSPIQFCLWLFLSSLHIINVYCEIIGYYYYFQEEGSDLVFLISSLLQIVLFLACFTCHFFSESQSDYQSPTETLLGGNESPLMNASYPSYIAFSWFTGFAWTGFKRALTFEDLHDLPPSIKSCNVVPPFLRNFFVRKNRFETDSVKLNGGGEDIKIVKSSNETQTSGVFRVWVIYERPFLSLQALKIRKV
jgi:hypothetical protein